MADQMTAIRWRGEVVGYMRNARPDMWYLEGSWMQGGCPLTGAFEKLAQAMKPQDHIPGGSDVWVTLLEEEEDQWREIGDATVISLLEGSLMVRRMIGERAKPSPQKRPWWRFW